MSRKNPGDFKPGENGYHKTVPEDLRQARRLTKIDVELVLNKYLYLPFGEIQAALRDPMKPTIEILIISVLLTAIKRGDHDRLNFVLDRIIGKVKQDVDVKVTKSFHEQCVDLVESLDADFTRIK